MRPVFRGDPPAALVSLVAVNPSRCWSSSGEAEVHAAIIEALRTAQDRLCAYCEQPVRKDGCVEHIHPKSVAPCSVRPSDNCHYDWTNLLLVCGRNEHCDGPKANDDICGDMLFPDEMDVGACYFTVNSLDGALSVAPGLPHPVAEKAERAIDLLFLNHANLKALRLEVVKLIQEELQVTNDEGLARHKALCAGGFVTTIETYFE